ncbi:MAG: response regulator [Planctomycetes bacterium]|nr:response regulator [Planctomycetota bacterium]
MSETSVKPLHVLILGELAEGEELSQWVDAHARVERVSTFEAGMAALRAEPFDLIISRAADFIPFQDVHVTRQAAAIIDSVSQGVGIVDRKGELEWANPKMLSYTNDVRDRVCRCCMETFRWAQAEVEAGTSRIRGRRFCFTTSANEDYEVTATPVIDLHERITQVAAVVQNTTNTRRLRDKIDAIDRAGRELLSLDVEQISRLNAQERLALLEQKIIRCTEELLHFDNFEIRVLNQKTNRLELVLASGASVYDQDTDISASAEGNGITGYVAARGKSYICPDTAADPRYLPGPEGAQSSLTVPLRLHDEVVGVANFESTKLAAFNEDSRQFAEIFSRYIALALHVLDLLLIERQTTTGQVGSNVMAEITAPLNDILSDVECLVEDYIGHDDLRHRLRAISENAVKIRETIKELTSLKAGIVGARSPRKKMYDPALSGKRILIADDEDTIRDTVRDVLIGYGCEVSVAQDGAKAIELIAQKPFDLVLSDIKMPVQDGYQVFAAAKEANPDTPVILTTGFGYDPNHSIIRARREGLAAVLFKPFKVDQLLNELRMALKSTQQ